MTAQQNAQLFHELTQLARSGLPMIRSLEIVGRKPGGGISGCARRLFQALQATGSVSEAFRTANFPESDAAVIEAGEATGRLEHVYQELEQYYTQLAAARRQVLAKSLYPVVVLHLGVLLLAIPPIIISGAGVGGYVRSVLPVFVSIYIAGFLLWVAWRVICMLVATNSLAARIILAVPVLGGFLLNWTSWKYASVLSLYVRAGGGLFRAVESAGNSCRNAVLHEASVGALDMVRQRGASLSEAFLAQKAIPETLERAIEVGEHSGRLDEETIRAADIFKTRTLQRLESFGEWTPKLLYFAIVLYVGWQIISMVMGLGASIDGALNME